MSPTKASRNIVLLAPGLYNDYGGIQTYMRLLVTALSTNDRLAAVTSLHDSKRMMQEKKERHGYSFDMVGADSSKLSFVKTLLNRRWDKEFLLLGHVSFAPIGWFLSKFGMVSGFGVILHGIEAWESLSLFRQFALDEGQLFISTTPYTRRRFEEVNNLFPERHEILPLSLEPHRFNHADTTCRAQKESGIDLKLVTISRLDEAYKGVDDVIRAVSLLQDNNFSIIYTIVGEGRDRPRLESLANQLGVSDSVIFEGKLSDKGVEKSLRSADAFVMPSTKEGFGLVYLEAMSFGLPIVASPEKGAKYVIRDKVNGLSVPANAPSPLATAFEKLMDDEYRESLREGALQDITDRFSFNRFCKDLERFLPA